MSREGFRELQPVDLWSKKISFPAFGNATFEHEVARISDQTSQSFSGYIQRDQPFGWVRTFTRTRYPRRKYGILNDEQMNESMNVLNDRFDDSDIINDYNLPQGLKGDFRVVLGLVEGYETDAPVHTIDEVRQALAGTSLFAMSAEVFSVRPHEPSDRQIYTEPCAIVTGNPRELPAVYDLADAFTQQRFTVEHFGRRQAWVVETPHCTSPDPE